MRLNRKWLYLGGLVTILTLLLTLTLVLPAGAVGQLDRGEISTDVDYVSPDDGLGVDARTVEVSLTISDLNITQTVEEDGDFAAVTLTVADLAADGATTTSTIDPVDFGVIVVNLKGGSSTDDEPPPP